MKKLIKIYEKMIYALPIVLFFSYYPIIQFGVGESMNFEISLPIIWLVVFSILSLIIFVKTKKLVIFWEQKIWLLLPIFLTVSLLWSANVVKGVLVVGLLWLIYIAIFSLVFLLRDFLANNEVSIKKLKRNFLRIFFTASLLICAWCFLQCVLDLMNVGRATTLMCQGCVYQAFGFPHPNGFAIEPQFMGNLMIAPTLAVGYLLVSKSELFKKKKLIFCFLVFATTLFLTFSRGAIYAFAIALVVMVIWQAIKDKSIKALSLVGLMLISFILTINVQGVFAQVSDTNDTYYTGVAKVINHLSLGRIDMRGENSDEENYDSETLEAETSEENEAVFDGYVAESTETRIELNDKALSLWSKKLNTIFVGVGIGGAGQALYQNGLLGWPKEIIQNEYISLLLEAGLVGVLLFVLTIWLILKNVLKQPNKIFLVPLILAFGITLSFFAGLPNVLQIYLLPALFYTVLRKKLVS